MTVITSLSNPVWQDTGVNVRVVEGAGRYEVRYPLISGETGIPDDFTTRADAISYAEHVAKTMRFTRNVAHGVALKEDARRPALVTTLDLVLRDEDGEVWVLIDKDCYAATHDVRQNAEFAKRWSASRAQLEADGPLTVQHSIEIHGEPA